VFTVSLAACVGVKQHQCRLLQGDFSSSRELFLAFLAQSCSDGICSSTLACAIADHFFLVETYYTDRHTHAHKRFMTACTTLPKIATQSSAHLVSDSGTLLHTGWLAH
jgi:hypothetical protein